MSDIFKTRKIPRHLIIEDEPPIRRRGRFGFGRLLLALLVASGMALLIMQLGSSFAL